MKKFAQIEISIVDETETSKNVDTATRDSAVKIAELLDRKAKPSEVVVLGEPNYSFVIALETKEFKGRVYVGDSTYSVELKHRKGEGAFLEQALFCVSFKTPDRIMFTKDRVAEVSRKLEVPVYRQGFVEDETVAKYLLEKSVHRSLAKIDFQPLDRLFLSPIHLEATSKLKDPSACAVQVRVLIELMNALACARKPQKEKPAANKKRSANRG